MQKFRNRQRNRRIKFRKNFTFFTNNLHIKGKYITFAAEINSLQSILNMKKEILDALKAKFEGVSEAILNRIADKLAKTVTKSEDVATAVEGVTFQQVLDSYGDSRATEATQTAVSNYEKKHGLKDGKAVKGGEPETKEQPKNEDTPAWAQSLIDSNKALTDRLNKLETERTSTSRRKELNAIVEKLPENLRKPYERMSIDTLTDEEFATLKSDVQNEVTSISNDLQARGAVFGQPNKAKTGNSGSGSNKEATDAEANAVLDKLNI